MSKPLVSFIIVTFNSSQYILDCVSSVNKQTYTNFEIIVVDNNSLDNTTAIIKKKFPSINIIQNRENCGFAMANNQGFKDAKGEYIIFLNPDTQVTAGWLEPIIMFMESTSNVGICQPQILLANTKEPLLNASGLAIHYIGLSWCINFKQPPILSSKKAQEISGASGACMVITSKLFSQLDGFDESYFMYHEDVDISWRVRLLGKKIFCIPQAQIFHQYQLHLHKSKVFHLEKNRLQSLIKNYSFVSLLLLLPGFFASEIILCFYFAFKRMLISKLHSYIYLIMNCKGIYNKRKLVQKSRLVEEKKILNIFSSSINFDLISQKLMVKILNTLSKFYWTFIFSTIKWIS